MRRILAIALAATLSVPAIAAGTGDDARGAAERLGRYLRSERSADLATVLPEGGKVRVALPALGADPGSYSPDQVEALLRNVLVRIDVTSFEVVRDWHDGPYALIRAMTTIENGSTSQKKLGFDLSFQEEDGRWVLRELRESPR